MKQCLIFLIILMVSSCSDNVPEDAKLVSVFLNNKATFEEIRSKMCLSRYTFIGRKHTVPKNIPQKEVEEYLSLLDKIGAKSVSKSKKCKISLTVWSEGLIGTHKMKGFAFNPSGGVIVDSLDYKETNKLKIGSYNVPIEDDWYLFFNHWK